MPARRRPWSLALGAAAATCAVACATTAPVRPLGRGNVALNASLGGPLVRAAGLDIPTPILMLGGAYGARDDLEVTARADVTAAAFGDVHVQPGVAYHPRLGTPGGGVPIVTVAGSLHVLTNLDDTRLYPQVTLAGAWLVGGRHLIYLGGDAGAGFGARTRVLAGPLLGGELRLGRAGLTLEGKWLAPYYDVAPTAPTWLSPFGRGYLAVLIGATFYTGAAR